MAESKKIEIFPRRYGFFPYVFLVYLFMPGYYISLENGWKAIIGGLLLLLFLVTYRQLYFLMNNNTFTVWLSLQIAVIVILSLFYNTNNIFLGFFSAHFIGWYANKKSFITALILFGIAITLPLVLSFQELVQRGGLFYYLPFIIIMLVSPFGIRSMNNRMELEQKLHKANEQIKELVKREERMRIARDLHDTLGHTLSLLTLKSQLIAKLAIKDPEKACGQAKEMERTARSALAQVRELVSDMRTITVAEELIEAQTLLQSAGISFRLKGETDLETVPHLTQNILSMCLKEAVTNVVKHSYASTCMIDIKQHKGKIVLSVQDDGNGLVDTINHGNGLKGMKERLELINGNLHLFSENGTKLVITVPIIVKEREDENVS